MELETQLNASDRETRTTISNNFKKIADEDEKDDSALQEEEDARRNADNREIQSRQAEDSNLQSQVNTLRGRLDTAEKNISDLQARQKADEDQIAKIYEAVFGIPSVILNEATSVDDEDNDDQPLEEINTERNGFLDAQ